MAAPQNAVAKPLQEFARLTPNIYLYTPQSAAAEPDMLIVMTTWMAAAPKHIAKYTTGHMQVFPSARILVVTNYFQDFFHSDAEYRRRLAPAIEVIREHARSSSSKILIHSFSNGGAKQLTQLAAIFKEKEGKVIPAKAIIFDSSPGKGTYWRSYAAIILSLPRNLLFKIIGPPILHLFLIFWGATSVVLGKENLISVVRRQLNDVNVLDPKAPRLYLYSVADEMVAYEDVEEHGAEAEAKGMQVTKVKFSNSAHAGHIMEDSDKYWGAVKKVWADGQS